MTKFVLIGAGSLQFGTGMLGDIFSSPSLSDAEIILHDINETAAKRVLAIAQQHIESKHYRHQVRVEPDLGRALQGAEFIVISIEVGDRFKLWDLDWKITPTIWCHPDLRRERGCRRALSRIAYHSTNSRYLRQSHGDGPDGDSFQFLQPDEPNLHRGAPQIS